MRKTGKPCAGEPHARNDNGSDSHCCRCCFNSPGATAEQPQYANDHGEHHHDARSLAQRARPGAGGRAGGFPPRLYPGRGTTVRHRKTSAPSSFVGVSEDFPAEHHPHGPPEFAVTDGADDALYQSGTAVGQVSIPELFGFCRYGEVVASHAGNARLTPQGRRRGTVPALTLVFAQVTELFGAVRRETVRVPDAMIDDNGAVACDSDET